MTTAEPTTEMVIHTQTLPAEPAPPVDAVAVREQVNQVQAVMQAVMKKDTHYGLIPGCGKKPALFKAGAEKLALACGFSPSFKVTQTMMPNEHREYQVECVLTHRPSGSFVANGYGSCTTMEGKYRYRYGKEHNNPADYYNTCLKMAKKRAYVDAVLTATGASDIFTQDIEDMPVELRDKKDEPQQQKQAAKPKAQQQRPAPPPDKYPVCEAAPDIDWSKHRLPGEEINGTFTREQVLFGSFDTRAGESKGKKFVLQLLTDQNNITYSTFSGSMATEARERMTHATVRYTLSESQGCLRRRIINDGLQFMESDGPNEHPDEPPAYEGE